MKLPFGIGNTINATPRNALRNELSIGFRTTLSKPKQWPVFTNMQRNVAIDCIFICLYGASNQQLHRHARESFCQIHRGLLVARSYLNTRCHQTPSLGTKKGPILCCRAERHDKTSTTSTCCSRGYLDTNVRCERMESKKQPRPPEGSADIGYSCAGL